MYKPYKSDTYGSERWILLNNGGNMLRNFERRILTTIYDTIKDNVIWRTRYNQELYTFYDELDILQVTKGGGGD